MASTISNANSIAYEFGSSQKGGSMLEVKRLAMTKKRKKELLSKVEALDKGQTGEISIEEFNRVSSEVNIMLDESDYEYLRSKYVRLGKI